MALNLTNVFTMLGRAGRNAYIVNGAQALQGVPFTELAGYAYVNPTWIAPLSQSYDPLVRNEPVGMSEWSAAVGAVLQGLVAAQNPAYGTSLSGSLLYLLEQMQSQAYYVNPCTIGSSVVADTAPANVGTGVVVVTLKRGDGLIQQNTVAETSTLLITADSYTGGATAGREPWQWSGAPNVSSFATGTPCNLWDFDWPQGSGAGTSGNCVSASQDASASGNMLTNGDFEVWDTSGTPFLSYWKLTVGTWGTSVQRATGGLDGGYCVQFNAGATLNALTQQFDSSVSDGTLATAGTTAAVAAYSSYLGNFWLKAGGVISGGVLTVSLVDSTGTVINDQAGTANSQTFALTAHSTAWVAHNYNFRLPIILPADGIVRLKFAITTALAGATLLLDDACYTPPTQLYAGGPAAAVFSGGTPFEAVPDPDGWSIITTNNRAGASYLATFQSLFNRLFQYSDVLLPYTGTTLLADTLITGV